MKSVCRQSLHIIYMKTYMYRSANTCRLHMVEMLVSLFWEYEVIKSYHLSEWVGKYGGVNMVNITVNFITTDSMANKNPVD